MRHAEAGWRPVLTASAAYPPRSGDAVLGHAMRYDLVEELLR
jgi:hypothetical protein